MVDCASSLSVEVEIYQLKDPDAVSKDHPSYHLKVKVLVNKSMNDSEA